MDNDPLDELVVKVRADTSGFMAGITDIQRTLDGPLVQGMDRAGGSIERALTRALVSGKFGFDDLRKVALGALADIAQGALRMDLGALFGGGGIGGGLTSLFSGLLGLPGRATGGQVSAGRAYRVGERGPETFVPTSSGRIEAASTGGGRTVNVTVNVAMPPGSAPAVMQQTGAQVARAVARALASA